MFKKIILLFFISVSFYTMAQSPKDIIKQAKKDFKAGNYKAAADGYTKALAQTPTDFDILIARAEAFEKVPDTTSAIADYKQAATLKPNEKASFMKVADLAASLRDYTSAATYLDKYLLLDRDDVTALQKLSFAYLNLKKFQLALDKINTALDRQRKNHLSHYYKALVLDSLGQYGSANMEYITAIKIVKEEFYYLEKPDPKFKPYYANHGVVLCRLGDYDGSIKEFETAMSIEPLDIIEPKKAQIYYWEHLPYFKKNDLINAIDFLNKSIALNPNYMDAFFGRALVYRKTSQFPNAISDYTKILQLNPKSAKAYFERAQCYMDLGDYPRAIADLRQANQLQPNNSQTQILLKEATEKNYSANKEDDPPTLIILSPQADNNGFINVFDVQQNILIEGEVKDKSPIAEILINNQPVKYDHDDRNPNFSYLLPNQTDLAKIEITTKDIYGNASSKSMKVGHIIENTRQRVDFAGMILADNSIKTPYANRTVYLTNQKGEVFFKTKTDANGRFKFEKLPYDRAYLLNLDTITDGDFKGITKFIITDSKGNTILSSTSPQKGKFNFEIIPSDVKTLELMTVNDEPIKIDLRGRLVAGNDSRTPLASIKFLLLSGSNEALAFNVTDIDGNFSFPNLIPNNYYSFAIDAFDVGKIPYDKIFVTDENGKIIKEISKNSDGTFKFKFLESERAMLTTLAQDEFDPWTNINFTSQKKEIEIIENIYYESGSFKILPAAEVVLQKTIAAMQKNPTLLLEVQSHTDATATDEYNMELSQKRANTVVDYLVNKGIAKNRLTAKGYGETQLINRCANGVECSDEEHRQNRRTVFKLRYP